MARRVARHWPPAERAALSLLDLAYQAALLPFRRARVGGRATEAPGITANAAAYNTAAEQYFAGFPDREFLDLPRDVRPGDQIVVETALPTPGAPGDYLVVFDLVVQGLTWFADRGSAPATLTLRM